MGRKLSPQFQILHGTEKSRRKHPPEVPVTGPSIPRGWGSWMSEGAKRVWHQFAPKLSDAGILTELDLPAFRVLCEVYADFIRLTNYIRKNGSTYRIRYNSGYEVVATRPEVKELRGVRRELLTLSDKFGMTPLGRTGVNIAPKSDDLMPDYLD